MRNSKQEISEVFTICLMLIEKNCAHIINNAYIIRYNREVITAAIVNKTRTTEAIIIVRSGKPSLAIPIENNNSRKTITVYLVNSINHEISNTVECKLFTKTKYP